ncbi:MAG: peptidase m75, imelysin [Reichenbachiella sp.]
MKLKITLSILLAITVGITSCDDNDSVDNSGLDALKASAVESYATLVFANYEDAYSTALDLQGAIETFIDTPTEGNFTAAKEAWLVAREPYGETEAFRFANGPIDDEDGPEGALNAWPLDENYIDYVEGALNSGIINDLANFPTISAEILEEQNELGGEANISIGYHAIEFLLWGQDLTAPSELMAGQRPYTDYINSPNGTASNQDRRGDYLIACADLLLDHLKSVKDEWDPAISGNYREEFLGLPVDQALTNILTAIGILGKSELAGERIFTAYDNQDQEDEHSCFSDNTHRDIRLNAQGIENVYLSNYTRTNGTVVSGTSINDILAEVDATLAQEVIDQIDTALEAVEATANPFDFAISSAETRPVVLTSVNELQTMGDKFAEVGTALGLSINTGLPE